ncbi:hypothetical protein [Euzebya rosea]|uniref:hypothetical protein n=1 Tax=Euzebya rosea TaxID=2052804 RepID=UPI001300478B|nr:hypothetical protein [Euzebya rosea]
MSSSRHPVRAGIAGVMAVVAVACGFRPSLAEMAAGTWSCRAEEVDEHQGDVAELDSLPAPFDGAFELDGTIDSFPHLAHPDEVVSHSLDVVEATVAVHPEGFFRARGGPLTDGQLFEGEWQDNGDVTVVVVREEGRESLDYYGFEGSMGEAVGRLFIEDTESVHDVELTWEEGRRVTMSLTERFESNLITCVKFSDVPQPV